MQTSTLKAILTAFNAASTDQTRYHLCGVEISRSITNKEAIRIRATDGHVLAELSVVDSDLATLVGTNSYFIDRESIPMLKHALKAIGRIQVVPISVNPRGQLELTILGGGVVQIRTIKDAGISFPDCEQVKPKLSGKEYSVSFDPELLLSLFRALNPEKEAKGATLTFKSPQDPITVDVAGQYGVLMPMRLGEKGKYRDPDRLERTIRALLDTMKPEVTVADLVPAIAAIREMFE